MTNIKKDHKTLEVRAYEAIKDMIIFGRIKPDVKLTEEGMAAELGVSRTTVKKAFIRLAQEGLLESVSAHGVQVKLMSLEEVLEAYEVREVLEGIAGRIACRVLDDAEIDPMIRTFEKIRENGRAADPDDYYRENFKLHKMIAKCCVNRSVSRLIMSLLIQTRSYRGGQPPLRQPMESVQEHLDILYAMKQRDEALTESLIRKHLGQIRKLSVEIIDRSANRPAKKQSAGG